MSSVSISIIMPVYNGASFLEECISSVINQTYTDWELLIIDDGSTDETFDVCEKYRLLDDRVRLFRQNRRGVSCARNIGLENAVGEYIAFVDSDDRLPETSLQARITKIENADMVIGMFDTIGGVKHVMNNPISESWNREEAIRNVIVSGILGYQGYIWNKLFRKTIIDEYNIRFAEDISYNEDRLFCVEYLYHSFVINIFGDVIYNYRLNPKGAMQQLKYISDQDKNKILSDLVAYDRMMDLVKEEYPKYYYLVAACAQARALAIKKSVSSNEKELQNDLNIKLFDYAKLVWKAPSQFVAWKKKIIMIGHAILRR